MKKLCVFHGNCADGFTSAWVVRKALGDDVDFHPGVYNNTPPPVEGRDVLMVDFSYKRPVLEQIRDQANSVLILDHHETAEADLKDLPGVQSVFDMKRSGCRITWDYYFPGVKPPALLLHVEDRDLWRFALRKTREIQASVFSYPYDFKAWDFLMEQADPEKLAIEGEAIERKHFKDIRELIGVVTREFTIGGHKVKVANLPYTLTSDAALMLAKDAAFGGCFWFTPEGWVFSLRSTEGGLNVAQIAKEYGGGGHKHAAGFRIPLDKLSDFCEELKAK